MNVVVPTTDHQAVMNGCCLVKGKKSSESRRTLWTHFQMWILIFRNRCSGTGKDQTSLTLKKFYPISAHRVQTKEELSEVITSCNLPSRAGVTTMAHALASWTVLEKAYEKVNRCGYVTMYLCKNVSSCVWIGTLVLWRTQSSSTEASGPA